MEINRGMQLAIQAFIKMMGLDPIRVQSAIEDIGKSVNNAAAEMRIIRKQNSAIMAHLGIAEPLTLENENARPEPVNGSQAGSA